MARAAVDGGDVDFIELCGAFGEEGCRSVIDAVGNRVPVGYVTYFPGDAERVDALFGLGRAAAWRPAPPPAAVDSAH